MPGYPFLARQHHRKQSDPTFAPFGWWEVQYAALRPGCGSPPVGSPGSIGTTLFRRRVKFRQFFRRFIEFGFVSRQLLRRIQFGESWVEQSLDGQLRLLRRSQFRRVGLTKFQRGIDGEPSHREQHKGAKPQCYENQQESGAGA